jgi:hypothetical protein
MRTGDDAAVDVERNQLPTVAAADHQLGAEIDIPAVTTLSCTALLALLARLSTRKLGDVTGDLLPGGCLRLDR